MYRFLFSRRWLGAFALAVVVAVGCVLLGSWQWDRREQRLERNGLVTSNYDRAPVAVTDLLPDPASPLPPRTEWTPVLLRGEYLADETLLLRNRPLDGRPGYHALVPFLTDAGEVVLVDRGWLPTGSTGAGPDDVPAPPPGTVEATVRLRPGEASTARNAPQGQLQAVDLPDVAESLPAEVGGSLRTGAYGVLGAEDPAPAQSPVLLPRPAIDEGPHLSYAFQWFVFAVGALAGFVVLVRRSAEDARYAAAPGSDAPARPPHRPRRPTAEDEEDALLDAMERSGRPPGP